jgi:glycosyltransferase involved in cell wall biosynthesis
MSDNRTLIIWDRIGDYHRARIRAFERLVGEESVFSADLGSADQLYGWENSAGNGRHFVLSDKPVDDLDLRARISAFREILKDQKITHLAVAGYAHPEYVFLLLLGRLAGCRIVMFGESWYGEGRIKNRLKGFFLKRLVHCFFLSGERARNHFNKRLRIPGDSVLTKYSVVDNQHFFSDGKIDRERVLLCVARFSPEKNLARLIRAFRQSKLIEDYTLRIIGGGAEKESLLGQIDERGRVELVDWVSYNELPLEYARARYFVLPSVFEPWGLVVNEAMAAGLPVLASEACGCVPDLITEKNGFTFPAESEPALIAVLNTLSALSEEKWKEMSSCSMDIISGYSCEVWAEQLKKGFIQDAHH